MLDEAERTPALPEELGAMLGRAAVVELAGTAWIEATGDDRVRWLNGMVTNSIQGMSPGEGTYSFLLNAQGRIQGELAAFAEPDPARARLLLEVEAAELERVRAWLDRYIIMDDVELRAAEELQAGLLVVGPEAERVLREVGIASVPAAEMQMVVAEWNGTEVRVLRGWGPLLPRYEVWTDAGTARTLEQLMVEAGAVRCGAETMEALRVLEGRPKWGVDLRDKELPQETGQTRALHFSKGCYLGQEIVERIRSRGNVHRGFAGFVLTGAVPEGDMQLVAGAESKPVGELTSVLQLPESADGAELLALGYVRREAVERGDELRYAGGVARVTELPFRDAATRLAGTADAPGRATASDA